VTRSTVIVGAALIAAAANLSPQSFAAGPAIGNVPTVTRLVKIFLEQEQALDAAIRSGDAQSLERLLTDDFELRDGAHPASPVPRAEWVHDVLNKREANHSVEGMAVHDFGTVAIASFSQSMAKVTTFVVDVWRRDGDAWKLAVRYRTEGRSARSARTPSPEIPKKY